MTAYRPRRRASSVAGIAEEIVDVRDGVAHHHALDAPADRRAQGEDGDNPCVLVEFDGGTERFGAPAGRFEVVGADAAEKFLLGKGVETERSAVVWEAIALHTSNGIALRRAPEVALVHIGASIDVMGLGLEKLPPTAVAQTIEALPRDNFKKVFVDALFSRVQKDPPSVALTWMSEAARRHVHGFECPDFIDLVSAANFSE